MPIPLLVLGSQDQYLVNRFIESGPDFVETAPTEEQQKCEANFFEVCQQDATSNAPRRSKALGKSTCFLI